MNITDQLAQALRAMHKLLDRDATINGRDILLPCESHDQAFNYLHEARRTIDAALADYDAAPRAVDPGSLVDRLLAGTGGGSHWMELHEEAAKAILGLQARLAAAPKDDDADFELHGPEMMLAATSGTRADALREILHYAAQYQDEGPLTIYEVRRTKIDAAAREGSKP